MAMKLVNGVLVVMSDAELIAFEDSRTLTLAQAKREMRGRIDARREAAERAGFVLPSTGARYASSPAFFSRLAVLAARARTAKAAGEAFTVNVVAADDSQSNMSANEIIALELAAGDCLVACSANARTLRQAVGNAADVAAVFAVDINAGWPP
jgi:hypothetical protein